MTSVTTVSTSELAEAAGISVQTAREFARRGIFVRTGRGKFDREASMSGYLAHLRRASVGKRGGGAVFSEAANERARLAAAQADAQEMKNQVVRRALIPEAEVESTWLEIVARARAAVLAAPARIHADLPHLSKHDVETIDRHLRDALTRLAVGP
jgi:terminase small subunit / prophage DNA-packing protein